jgi:acetolactate synthase regulatory subunit
MRRSDDTEMFDPAIDRELAAIDATLRGEPVEADLADLAELTRLLHDERARVSDDFAASLDTQVARGFRPAGTDAGGEGRAGVLRRFAGRMRAAGRPPLLPAMGVAASLIIAVVVATSVIGGKDEAANRDLGLTNGAPTIATESAPGAATSKAGSTGAAGSAQSDAAPPTGADRAMSAPVPAPSGGSTLPGRQARSVERQATIALTAAADKIDDVSRRVMQTTDAVGGIVVSSNIETSRNGGSASFELRVPSARLEESLAKLSKLADVRSRSQNSQDITTTVVSARDRLDEYLAERTSLLRQLAKASTANATASLKSQLAIVRQEIAGARTQVRRLAERTSYSVVHVTIDPKNGNGSVTPISGNDHWSVADAWKDARRVLEVAAGVAIIGIALMIPVGILGAAGGFGGRRALRRRRERTLDLAA